MGSLFSSSSDNGNNNKQKNKSNKTSKQQQQQQQQVTSKDRAILDLKNAKDRLKKFKKKLEQDSEKLTNEAKELIKQQKKDRALLVLKVRRFKENELNQLDGKLLSIMEMIEQVEWESANMEVLKALKAGNDVLNKFHQEMSVEDVEALLEETNEAIEVENQINLLLAGQLSQFDEEALEEELSQIMATSASAAAKTTVATSKQPTMTTNSAAALPNAPTHIPSLQTTNKTDEVEDDVDVDTRQTAVLA